MLLDNLYKVMYSASAMNDFISLTTARANFPRLVAKVGKTSKRVTITVKGKPKAVLISAEDLESLEETLDILSEPGALEEIREAENEIKKGNYVTFEELKAQIEAEHV